MTNHIQKGAPIGLPQHKDLAHRLVPQVPPELVLMSATAWDRALERALDIALEIQSAFSLDSASGMVKAPLNADYVTCRRLF